MIGSVFSGASTTGVVILTRDETELFIFTSETLLDLK